MSGVAFRFLFLAVLGGCVRGTTFTAPSAMDSGIGVDSAFIDQRKVDCGGDCAFAATYTVSSDGFFGGPRDRAILSPSQGYRHLAVSFEDGGGKLLECAPTLPHCVEEGPVSICDISQDLADPDVQQALTESAAPTFGCDCRAADFNVFSFMRDDGHGFFVGHPTTAPSCHPPSCRVTIPDIPSGIARLVADLHTLDAALILSAECLNLNVSLQVAGTID